MHACDIRQYLIHQYVFYTISPNITLANISTYTVVQSIIGDFKTIRIIAQAYPLVLTPMAIHIKVEEPTENKG